MGGAGEAVPEVSRHPQTGPRYARCHAEGLVICGWLQDLCSCHFRCLKQGFAGKTPPSRSRKKNVRNRLNTSVLTTEYPFLQDGFGHFLRCLVRANKLAGICQCEPGEKSTEKLSDLVPENGEKGERRALLTAVFRRLEILQGRVPMSSQCRVSTLKQARCRKS